MRERAPTGASGSWRRAVAGAARVSELATELEVSVTCAGMSRAGAGGRLRAGTRGPLVRSAGRDRGHRIGGPGGAVGGCRAERHAYENDRCTGAHRPGRGRDAGRLHIAPGSRIRSTHRRPDPGGTCGAVIGRGGALGRRGADSAAGGKPGCHGGHGAAAASRQRAASDGLVCSDHWYGSISGRDLVSLGHRRIVLARARRPAHARAVRAASPRSPRYGRRSRTGRGAERSGCRPIGGGPLRPVELAKLLRGREHGRPAARDVDALMLVQQSPTAGCGSGGLLVWRTTTLWRRWQHSVTASPPRRSGGGAAELLCGGWPGPGGRGLAARMGAAAARVEDPGSTQRSVV